MKHKKVVSVLLAGIMSFSFGLYCPVDSLFPEIAIEVNAAEGRLYNQNDSYWKTVKFTKYSSTENDMYTSGCGIFSFCNAIYALNGNKPDAVEVATWAVSIGAYQPGNGGVYRETFYKNVQSKYGNTFNFKIDGYYSGKVTDARLINHLNNGGVATIHVSNHFMAITGYNANNNTYHVIESAVYSGRGLQADSWVSASKLSSGSTNVDWYALISNTKPSSKPGWAKVTVDKKSYKVGENVTFNLSSDTGYSYTVGIDSENGERTRIDTQQLGINDPHVYTRSFNTPGNYSCYITTYNDYGLADSERIYFTIYTDLSVKFDANGGSCSTPSKNVTYPMTYGDLPTPTKNGYTFDGWYTEKTGGTRITADTKVTVTENQTLYAHWVDKEAPVINSIDVANLTMDGFSLVIKATDTAGIKAVNVDACTWRGFDEEGKTLVATKSGDSWICDINISDFNGSHGAYYCVVRVIDVNGNTTSSDTKEVKVATFTCTFDANGGTVEQQKVLVYGDRYGRITNLPTPVCEGKIFQGWYTEKTAGVKVTDDMIFNGTKDQTLYARWRVKGDIDTDDKIGVTDIITVQKYLHRNNEFTKEQYEIADMNGDGKVNVIDLALMKRQLLQK